MPNPFSKMKYKIPLYKPLFSGNEQKYVNECMETSWISSRGRFVNLFEEKFAEFIGIEHSIAVCNGTVSLHLALLGLDIGPGDEVIVPTLTYISSVNVIAYVGATPVFVDSLPDSWQMDPEDVKKKITSKTKAIMAVHLYGQPADMSELVEICQKNKLFLIEDCAEAIGSKFKDQYVGSFGDISSFSFYGNKTITTGEGGMILIKDKKVYEKLMKLKAQGIAGDKEYWHDVIGYNYRMTNICAAIGVAQLEQVNSIIEKKVKIAETYQSLLKGINVKFHDAVGPVFHSYWMCSILVEKAEQRDALREYMTEHGVETRPLFYPIHTMPMYFEDKSYPVAENLAYRGMNLPSYPELTTEQIKTVVDTLAKGIEFLNASK